MINILKFKNKIFLKNHQLLIYIVQFNEFTKFFNNVFASNSPQASIHFLLKRRKTHFLMYKPCSNRRCSLNKSFPFRISTFSFRYP